MQFNENPSTGNGGIFLKLKEGESAKAILRGNPIVFYKKWENNKYIECERADEGAKFKFKVNALVNEDGVYKAKIFENGPTFYNALKALSEDYDLEKTVVKISRKGSGLDTEYSVLPLPVQLNNEQLKMLDAVELNPLDPQSKKPAAASAPNFELEDNESIPF
jgi:hypothetical protein